MVSERARPLRSSSDCRPRTSRRRCDKRAWSTWRDDFGNVVAHVRGDRRIFRAAHRVRRAHGPSRLRDRGDRGDASSCQGDGWRARRIADQACARIRPRARWDKDSRSDGPHEDTTDPNDRTSDRLVRVRLDTPVDLRPPLPVVFGLSDFDLDGDTIRMRAVDDLAGCAAILALLERVARDGSAADVYGVFTRAEEGGLFGARLMAEAGTLPEETIVVSVESSAVIPGVAQGAGPVVRTGDALTTFDSGGGTVARRRRRVHPPPRAGASGRSVSSCRGECARRQRFL